MVPYAQVSIMDIYYDHNSGRVSTSLPIILDGKSMNTAIWFHKSAMYQDQWLVIHDKHGGSINLSRFWDIAYADMDWNWDTIRKRKQQWHLPTPPPTSYWASWVRELWPHHLALAKNATHLSPWRCDANIKKLPLAPQQHEKEEKMMNKNNRKKNKNKKNHCHWSYYSWHSYETCSCRIAHAASSCHLLIFLLSQSTASIPPLHTTTRSGSTETLYSSQQVFNLNEFLWKWGRPINDLGDLGYLHFRTPPSSTPFRHLLSSLGQGFAQARKPCRGRVVDVTLAERFGTRLLEVSGKNGGECPQKRGNWLMQLGWIQYGFWWIFGIWDGFKMDFGFLEFGMDLRWILGWISDGLLIVDPCRNHWKTMWISRIGWGLMLIEWYFKDDSSRRSGN